MEKVVLIVLLVLAVFVVFVLWRLRKWREGLTVGSKVEFKRHKVWLKGTISEVNEGSLIPAFYVSVNGREYWAFDYDLYPQNGSELFWLL